MFQLICDLTIKATILLLAATTINLTLRKSSAAARHRLWGLTMIGLLGMPLLPLLTPAIWSLTVPPDVAAFIPSVVPAQRSTFFAPYDSGFATPSFSGADPTGIVMDESADSAYVEPTKPSVVKVESQQSSWIDGTSIAGVIPLIWAGGMLLVLLNLAVGTWRVMRFKAGSNPVTDSAWQGLGDELRQRLGLKKQVELREHPGDVVPLTLGVMRPVVVLPRQARNWTDRLKRTVLLHELAHVRRRDIVYQWLCRLACALYWFHPLAWWGLRKLRQEREQACDDLVIHCGERATEYAEDLVFVAKSFQSQRGLACVVAMARHGNLEGRMRSLFDADVVRSHAPLGRLFAVALLLSVAAISTTVSAVQLAAQSGDDPDKDTETPAGDPGVPIRFLALGADGKLDYGEEFDEGGKPQHRKPGPFQHTVTITNDKGEPVVGAKVIPRAFGTDSGGRWGWFKDIWPKEFTTNEEGVAVILVPEQLTAAVTMIVPLEAGSFSSVSFAVQHPDYAPATKSMVELGDKTPVELSRGVIIAPHAIIAATNQPITSDLFALSSGYPVTQWTFKDGELRSAPVDTAEAGTGKYFRLIHAPIDPPDAPILFSDVIDATEIPVRDRVARMDVPLYPGIRLSGKLSAAVPRPLKKGGRVIASVLAGDPVESGDIDLTGFSRQTVVWDDVAMIDEDGNFEFPFLPRQSHVELIAMCDGWVSKANSEDLIEYDELYQTKFQQLNSATVASTPVRLEDEQVRTTLDMVQTGICEFLVEDESGKPLDLATVHCGAIHETRSGAFGLGQAGSSLDYVRNPNSMMQIALKANFGSYSRATNPDGRVVISNLPADTHIVTVQYPGYKLMTVPGPNRVFPITFVKIMPGAAPTMTLSMEPDPETSAAMHAAPSHDGFSRIAISFVDSEGAPVSGVHVNLRGQSILHPEERQPWPTEWSSDVAFAEAGTAMIRLQIPAIPSAEKRAKMKVWFDAECPGYVPLTDQEYSLTKHLPIRMQAR